MVAPRALDSCRRQKDRRLWGRECAVSVWKRCYTLIAHGQMNSTHAHFNISAREIGHVRYINIQAWLRGFQVKITNFSSFFCPPIPKRDLNTKKTTPNIEVSPESLGAMLEYWYIERGLLARNWSLYSVCPPFWILTVEWFGAWSCLFWWRHCFQIASFSPSTLENSVFK